MRRLLILAAATIITGGCSTPIERAKSLCNEFGDPSPACIERRYDIERKDEEAFQKEFHNAVEESSPASIPSTESGYDRMLKQQKEDCLRRGGTVIGQNGCEIP